MLPDYFTQDRCSLEEISKQRHQTALVSEQAVLCRVLGKYIFYADPSDIGITPHLCLDGYWESWITLALARIVRPGWNCIDVGANHGYYSVIMADAVEESGFVMAIEPNPQLAHRIATSLEVNGFQDRASVLQRAVSDEASKRTSLVIPRNRSMDATLCRTATAADDVIEVETVTIDQVAADWPHLDLIKIDAEGAEPAIWRGMRAVLERNPLLTVVMETRCSRYPDAKLFISEILDAGFPLRHIAYDGSIETLTEAQILNERSSEDWMLFLRR